MCIIGLECCGNCVGFNVCDGHGRLYVLVEIASFPGNERRRILTRLIQLGAVRIFRAGDWGVGEAECTAPSTQSTRSTEITSRMAVNAMFFGLCGPGRSALASAAGR